MLISQSAKDEHSFESVRHQYEQQITELQAKVEELIKDKQEIGLNRACYDSTLAEYESRYATYILIRYTKYFVFAWLLQFIQHPDLTFRPHSSQTDLYFVQISAIAFG